MSRTLLLGKSGDILSVLPCLQAEFKETGIKPSLIVAKEYAALPKSLSWIRVEEFQGSFEDINGAIKWAKQSGKIDFIPQMSGLNHSPERKHPSFQYDQWDRMGRLHQWRELTLELPRPLNAAPWHCRTRDAGCILLADHSQSSPFPHVEDLYQSLKKSFQDYEIIRMSTLRLPNLLDALQLLDDAALMISVDTSFAHLSRACSTPFIMLATDVPSTWHGTAFHPRMSLHVRYSDYSLRKSELLHVAKEILKTS